MESGQNKLTHRDLGGHCGGFYSSQIQKCEEAAKLLDRLGQNYESSWNGHELKN